MNTAMIRRLTWTELKLNLRDWATTGFGLVLPVGLLVGLGSIPGVDRPDPALGGRRGIDTWVPSLSFTLSFAMLAWFMLPVVLSTYRERGVLRRLATTPARPAALLAAQLIANLLLLAVSLVAVFTVGMLVLDMSAPRNMLGFVAVLSSGVLSLFGIGLLLAAVIPSQRAAQGITWMVFAPSAFLAGVYVPIQFLPGWVAKVGDFTPLAAFRAGLEDVWVGASLRPQHLAVLLVTTVLAGLGAVRFFRSG
jgi:ABC-2 type transport system permease protein